MANDQFWALSQALDPAAGPLLTIRPPGAIGLTELWQPEGYSTGRMGNRLAGPAQHSRDQN